MPVVFTVRAIGSIMHVVLCMCYGRGRALSRAKGTLSRRAFVVHCHDMGNPMSWDSLLG